MRHFPFLSKRKANTLSNGIFLILLGLIFYSGHLWPGILFAFGFSIALRQYFTGRKLEFIITLILVGFLGILTLIGYAFSLLTSLFVIGIGIFLIAKESLGLKTAYFWKSSHDSENFRR